MKSIVTDEEEQPGTRARISALIAGLHVVDVAEDEISSGDGITDEWLSSEYPETHMSQKMVLEANSKEMERFKRMKAYRVVTRESMERRRKDDQHQVGHHEQRNGRTSNCQGTSGSTRVQHWRQNVVSCLQEQQV